MNLPRISIIVPVYNVEPYIAECLQSVMRQNYVGPMECIVVDDCGTDRSMAIAEEMIASYEGTIEFRVLHFEQNQGLSVARNAGIEEAKGDYVFFLDSDDAITNDCIDYLVNLLGDGHYDISVGNFDFLKNEISQGIGLMSMVGETTGEQYAMKAVHEVEATVAVWNKLFSLPFLRMNNLSFVPGIILEDSVFTFRLSCLPTNMIVGDKVTYYYRIRQNSVVRSLTPATEKESYHRVWFLVRSYCSALYKEVHEEFLYVYGMKLFNVCKKNKLSFRRVFSRMNREYPYKPLMVWLSGKQTFHWFKTRMIWSLPPFLGYIWFQLKWSKNNVLHNAK